MKTMTLSDGVAYVEKPAPFEADKNACIECALYRTEKCIESTAPSIAIFGGDCCKRAVIYIKADPQPVKE